MTFGSTNSTIQPGDWVIVYNSRQSVDSVTVSPGKEIQSRYGCFRHNDMVGKEWGFKLTSTNKRGFVYLLKPTPELWTLALPHRTQILYLPDIAFITSYLDVKPGSQIIEAGTGSGSFTHSLARTVGSEGGRGKVHSFEYHEERFEKAREEFASHGLSEVVTIKHQNVYKDGFGGLENQVDSVFLDLPAPWEALEHAKKAMRKDRQSRICCFSPCIEQVIRTCSALAELGFSDITMYETLTRTHDPYIASAPSISTAVERIKLVEVKKERRREGQIEEARRKREEKKRKAEGEAGEKKVGEGEGEGHGEKKVKVQAEEEDGGRMEEDPAVVESAPAPAPASVPGPTLVSTATATSTSTSSSAAPSPSSTPAPPSTTTTMGKHAGRPLPSPSLSTNKDKEDREFTAKVGPYARGHTSYLTFAVLLPEVKEERREEERREGEKGEGEMKEEGKKEGVEGKAAAAAV